MSFRQGIESLSSGSGRCFQLVNQAAGEVTSGQDSVWCLVDFDANRICGIFPQLLIGRLVV